MDIQMRLKEILTENIELKQMILRNVNLLDRISEVSKICTLALKGGHKLMLCGNGGSAADAQHIAAELTGRFYKDRAPYDAEALHVNSSYLTAVANDYSFEDIYERQVRAKGKTGDILIGISTSGNSLNVLNAMVSARKMGIITVGLTGGHGGKMADLSDYLINIPSSNTPRIQEAHIMVGHMLCEIIEENLST